MEESKRKHHRSLHMGGTKQEYTINAIKSKITIVRSTTEDRHQSKAHKSQNPSHEFEFVLVG